MSATTRICAAALAAGLTAAVAAAAVAQEIRMPEWQAPELDAGAGKGRQTGAKPAGASGRLDAPMRKIDRSEIDMTGVGREVRNFGSGVRPMMNGGAVGVGGGF
ncbi:hypothetical protein ACFFJB_07800 [Camelimonas abortus]|uniref:Uncharacterized protein n=1 Tax=Camelimonas abortus TaxID=1017184 RepID=A0ABV7LHJ9_9HYPH